MMHHLIFSCLEDFLLSKVNINSGEEESILSYEILNEELNIKNY